MDYEALKFWFDVAWKLGSVAAIVWLALSQRPRKNAQDIEDLAEKVAEHDGELKVLREELKRFPTTADQEKLHDRISNVNSCLAETRVDIGKMVTAMEGVTSAVNRIQNYLLEKER